MLLRLFRHRVFTSLHTSRRLINQAALIEQCWKCQRSIDRNDSPTHCPCDKHVLLPLRTDIDYFRLFQLPRSFELDTRQLTRTFRNKMKFLHPDLFTNQSDTEKSHSQDQSSYLNAAYKTLLSPLARAHYLLKLENLTLEDSRIQLEPDFLMRIMEINEQLSEDEANQKAFPMQLAIEMREEIDKHMKQLSEALNTMDMEKAKIILARIQYFNNIDEKLTELEEKHGII